MSAAAKFRSLNGFGTTVACSKPTTGREPPEQKWSGMLRLDIASAATMASSVVVPSKLESELKPAIAPIVLFGFLVQAGAALAHQTACSPRASLAITEEDRERLTELLSSRSRGLGEALGAEDEADRAAVGALFRDGFTPVQTVADGQYRCRTMKLGGISPLVVYSHFACTVRDGGTVVEKTSGSQRFTGSLTPAGGGLIYVGALHYGNEEPIGYDQDAERNQIGCLQRVAGEAKRFVLELPAPKFESTHDVIEFTTD